MNGRRIGAALVAVGFAAAGVVAVRLAPESCEPVAPATPGETAAALASTLVAAASLRPPAPVRPDAPVGVWPGADPAALLRLVEARVRLVPYHGLLQHPSQVLAGGAANGLDRARCLRALLEAAGHRARVVVLPAGAARVAPAGAASTRGLLAPALAAALEAEVARVGPALRTRLAREAAWTAAAATPGPEPEVAWVQLRRGATWLDLRFADTALPADVAAARQLWAADERARAWRVRLTLQYEAPRGAVLRSLVWESPAADLHARAITVANLPTHDRGRLQAHLLVDGKVVTRGVQLHVGGDDVPVRLALRVDVEGPGGARSFVRELAGAPRPDTSAIERAFELAFVARLAVTTGPVDAATLDRATAAALRRAGRLLLAPRDPRAGAADAPPEDGPSVRALALLRASSALAAGAAAAVGFQDRPALAIDLTRVVVRPTGLERRRGLDLVDPGHAFRGPDAAGAAADQAIVDGALETIALGGLAPVDASHGRAAAALLAGEPLAAPRAAGAWSDAAGGATPTYVVAPDGAGWRLDPGPQVVPILADGTGGAATIEAAREGRVRTVTDAIGAAALLAPLDMLPAGALTQALAAYFARLRKAWLGAAGAMRRVAAMIAGDEGPSPAELARLERQLQALGPQLASDLATSLLADAAGGRALGPVGGVTGRGAAADLVVNGFVKLAIDQAIARAGGTPTPGAIGAGCDLALEVVRSVSGVVAREMTLAGWPPERVQAILGRLADTAEVARLRDGLARGLDPDQVLADLDAAP